MENTVVISGIGGRFPDCYNFDEFKSKLLSGECLLQRDPKRTNRKVGSDEPLSSGRIPEWSDFDPTFFGVHPILAHNTDPIKGQVMERSFEAILDSGTNPFELKGQNVAVIVSTGSTEGDSFRFLMTQGLHALGLVGTSKTMLANRFSYFFNFTGPSYQCDEAGSGGISLLQQAAELIRQGQADAAVVASANMFLWDSVDVELNDLNLLSSTRKCRPFDERADGLVRSEGVVAFFIQKAQSARRNYCAILKAETRFLGESFNSFVQVSPQYGQFLKNLYKDVKIHPSEVAYVEANCLSTHEFDAIELNAIHEVFKKNDMPLLIGSVAGNVGNGQAVSGLLSIAKAISALETGTIPKTLNHEIPNSKVPGFLDNSLKTVTKNTELNGDVVAVTNLGFQGVVSHVLLQRHSHTKQALSKGELPEDGLHRLVLFQARHEAGVSHVLKELTNMELNTSYIGLVNGCFKTQIPAYLYRGYAILPLEKEKQIQNMMSYNPAKRPVWYIFSGMGSQWAGMGRDLLQFPVFAAAIDKCDKVLRPRGLDIRDIITTDDPTVFDNILNCFVGIAAIQVGLVDILSTVGVSPDGMIGHSVGELGCGYADGCFSLEQTVIAAYARGKASLEAELIPGMMAAIGLGYNDIKHKLPAFIDVACHNARDSCTLSGPTEDINTYVKQLQDQGVFARAVSAGGIAYHSRYIKDVAPKLQEYLNEAIQDAKPRSSKWISSSVPEAEWNTDKAKLCSAEYHTNNLLSPVLFEEACTHLPKNAVLIEIAPRGLLQAILRRSITSTCVSLSLTNRNLSSNVLGVLETLGKLYLHNVDVDINALYPPLQYPVPRNTPGLARLATWNHDAIYYAEFLRRYNIIKWSMDTKNSRVIEISAQVPEFNEWKKTVTNQEIRIPLPCLLEYLREVYIESLKKETVEDCIVYEDVIVKYTISTDRKGRSIAIHISSIGHFEVSESMDSDLAAAKDVVRGTIRNEPSTEFQLPQDLEHMSTASELEDIDVINYLQSYGIEIENNCQLIEKIWINDDGCSAQIKWTGDITWFLHSLFNVVKVYYIDVQQQLANISSFKELKINTKMLSTLPIGSTVEVFYDHLCKTLVCQHVRITELYCNLASPSKPPSMTWTHMSLQPYFDTNTSISNFVSSCVQLSVERGLFTWNQKPVHLEIITINTIESELCLTEAIMESAKIIQNIKVRVINTDFKTAIELLQNANQQQRFLIIGDGKDVLALSGLHDNNANVFYLTSFTTNHLKQIVPILTLKQEEKCFGLLRLVNQLDGVKCVEARGLDWLQNLRHTVCNNKNEHPLVVFTHSLKPKHVLPVLAKEPYADRIRTVFVEDKDAPQFDLNSPFYQAQIRLGLPVNILSNKVWNSLRIFNIQPNPCSTSLRNSLNRNTTENVINYIGFNLNLTCVSPTNSLVEDSNEIRYLDYSGMENGKKVMGIAKFDPVSNSVTLDPILKWEAQDSWSLEDLATIPATYSLAYYCMLKGELKPSESVLIHLGMSLVGQALVNLCLNLGATVYVSVNDDNEAIDLQKQFPELVNDNIIILERQSLRTRFHKLTSGRGVDMVINGHLGKQLRDAMSISLRFGRLYHLGDTKSGEEEIIGLNYFMKSTYLRGTNLSFAMNCDDLTKHKLKKAIDLGLKSCTIQPFKKQIFHSEQQNEAFRYLTLDVAKKPLIVVNKTPVIAVNSATITHQSVIIAGGNTDFWLDVMEWLVDQGCRKVAIVLSDEQKDTCYMRRIQRLVESKKTALAFTSIVKLETPVSSVELLADLTNVAPVSSVFCVEMDEDSEEIRNLDYASRQVLPDLEHFVCLLGEGTAVSESREASGLPIISVQRKTPLYSPKHILPYIATILQNAHCSYDKIFRVEYTYKTAQIDDAEFEAFVPSFDKQLNAVNVDEIKFNEVMTLSPGYSHVRHCLLPLFFIPGLDSDSLQPLFKQLFNPAFCSTSAFTSLSVEDFANKLLQNITNIQSRGPYNIVGESWGGLVALALSRKLEANGHQVHLFVIEASPSLLRHRLATLSKICSDNGRSSPFKSNSQTKENCTQFDSNRDKPTAQGTLLDTLKTCLDSLHRSLGEIAENAQPIQGQLTIIKREAVSIDFGDISKLSVKRPTFFSTEDKEYQQLISSPAAAIFINETTEYSWDN